jgi:hypothetical protein
LACLVSVGVAARVRPWPFGTLGSDGGVGVGVAALAASMTFDEIGSGDFELNLSRATGDAARPATE